MKIITLANEKGGTGKTTLAVTLASGLAILGKRVLLADADPQGHATIALNFAKQPGIYDLLVRDVEWNEVLRTVPVDTFASLDATKQSAVSSAGRFLLLPGNIETISIASHISDAFSVGDRLHELENMLDYVIIDTSPTPSLLNGIIALVTDAMLYPTTCESLAIDGLAESLNHRDQATTQRARYGVKMIETLGIIPTLYRQTTLEHRENLDDLRGSLGDFLWAPIPQRTVWPEATRKRKSIFAFSPESDAAEDGWKFVQRVEEALHAVRA